ncbi:hypothetical protein [Methanobacterium oryzae]|uniref:hypothetical protein n=1 Tax=Methanobacterium oryzae TaxID=69540 RepID=UPI003D207C9E
MFIIAILAVVVFASGCTDNGNQNNTQNNTTVNQNSTSVKAINVIATQKGPETAKKGMNVTIQYTVSNKGSENVTNVSIVSQGIEQTIGTLKSGETKTYTSQLYIPTDAEVQEDFGINSTVSNPFFIGGFNVKFNDANGNEHSIMSNSIEIKLV